MNTEVSRDAIEIAQIESETARLRAQTERLKAEREKLAAGDYCLDRIRRGGGIDHRDSQYRQNAIDRLRMSCITPSGKRALRSGMACKAQTAAVAHATARICNTAGHPIPQMNAARGGVQAILNAAACASPHPGGYFRR